MSAVFAARIVLMLGSAIAFLWMSSAVAAAQGAHGDPGLLLLADERCASRLAPPDISERRLLDAANERLPTLLRQGLSATRAQFFNRCLLIDYAVTRPDDDLLSLNRRLGLEAAIWPTDLIKAVSAAAGLPTENIFLRASDGRAGRSFEFSNRAILARGSDLSPSVLEGGGLGDRFSPLLLRTSNQVYSTQSDGRLQAAARLQQEAYDAIARAVLQLRLHSNPHGTTPTSPRIEPLSRSQGAASEYRIISARGYITGRRMYWERLRLRVFVETKFCSSGTFGYEFDPTIVLDGQYASSSSNSAPTDHYDGNLENESFRDELRAQGTRIGRLLETEAKKVTRCA